MKHQIVEPPPHLTHLVRYFWTLEHTDAKGEKSTIKTIVDDSTGIIVQQSNGESGFENKHGVLPKIFIYGHSTHPTITTYHSNFAVTGVALKPGVLHALTRENASQFTDSVVELSHFAGNYLNNGLLECAGQPCSIRSLTELISLMSQKVKGIPPLMARSLSVISERKGAISVQSLLREVASSERHLERMFKKTLGIPPTLYIRIIRFQEAMRRIRSGRHQKLSDVALDTGYYDQSHFIKEFKKFSGYAPKVASEEIKGLLLNLEL